MKILRRDRSKGVWSGTKAVSFFLTLLIPMGACLPQYGSQDRDLARVAERIFAEAKELMEAESHWEATRELVILMDYYSGFDRMDEVILMLANCLYEMELYHAATPMYIYLVKNYFGSPLLPKALLGLEKAKYKEGNYQESLNFYEAILQAPRPVDVDDEARYFAGQSYYNIKDYPSALEALLNVDPRGEYYDYGLYTVGLSLLRMKRVKRAVAVFRKLVSLPIISEERRAVVDEGRLTLGFIYYELGYYREAIGYHRDISSNHRRYADALLATGWSSIKLGDYQAAIGPLVKLVGEFPDDHKAEEALFLLGRSYLALNFYDDAINVYEKIIDLFPEEALIPDLVRQVNRSLELEEKNIEKLRVDLLVLESKLLDTLPLDEGGVVPYYLKEEKEKLDNSRDTLLQTIMTERKSFVDMQAYIGELRELLTVKLDRKSWRAYAEYGKSRALFLKGTDQERGN